ncbi:hypothetical protein [Mycolicibacterium fortuitum]|uniref:hypothetical protein n=1 Tax=Mycolicibacterium fortuitum TaxID=1766 RepID=UPI00262EF751|nr:hypothetical protein [Mycolicibacterium fortuitum]
MNSENPHRGPDNQPVPTQPGGTNNPTTFHPVPPPNTAQPPPNGGTSVEDNRGLLRVIAVACTIMALGTLAGLAIWGYSLWKTKQLVDDITTASPPSSRSRDDLPVNSMGEAFFIQTGTWSGEIHLPGTHVLDMWFDVKSTSPIAGQMTFGGPIRCIVDVEEESRTESKVVLTTTAVPASPPQCAENGRWEFEWQKLDGNPYDERLLGDLVWSSGDSLIGSYSYLYPPTS